jgi:hypothetical protein
MSTTWEDVEVPKGTYIGWGKVGQTVTGKVLSFSADGAKDFNGNVCPLLVLELTEQCDNYRDKGATHETISAGELVSITAGQAALKQAVVAAGFRTGDLTQIVFEGTHKSSAGNDVKDFKVRVARGATPEPSDGDLI